MFIITFVAVFHFCGLQEARSRKAPPRANAVSPSSPTHRPPKEGDAEEYSSSSMRGGKMVGEQVRKKSVIP